MEIGDKVKINCIDADEGFPYEEIGIIIRDHEPNFYRKEVDIKTSDGRIITGIDKLFNP